MSIVSHDSIPREFGTHLCPELALDAERRPIQIGDIVRTVGQMGGDAGGVVVSIAGACITFLADAASCRFEAADAEDLRVISDARDLARLVAKRIKRK